MEPDRQYSESQIATGACAEAPGAGEYMRTDSQMIDDIAVSLRQHFNERAVRHIAAIEGTAETIRNALGGWRDRLVSELEQELISFDDGLPPSFVQVAGQSHLEKPLNRLLAWMTDPEGDHGWGRQFLLLLARFVELHEMVSDLEMGLDVKIIAEQAIEDDDSGKEPDLIIGTPHAALMLENKLWAPESGDQYGPYLTAFRAWAKGRRSKTVLCAPNERAVPAGWDRSILHQDLGHLLMRIADGETRAPVWGRISAAMCAVTFQRQSHHQTIIDARQALESARQSTPSLEQVARLRGILPLPRPITPWKESQ